MLNKINGYFRRIKYKNTEVSEDGKNFQETLLDLEKFGKQYRLLYLDEDGIKDSDTFSPIMNEVFPQGNNLYDIRFGGIRPKYDSLKVRTKNKKLTKKLDELVKLSSLAA